MPCRVNEGECADSYLEVDELRKQLDLVTRLLCAICRDLERNHTIFGPARISMKGDLAEWWKNHKKNDEARIKGLDDRIAIKKQQIEKINKEIAELEVEKSS